MFFHNFNKFLFRAFETFYKYICITFIIYYKSEESTKIKRFCTNILFLIFTVLLNDFSPEWNHYYRSMVFPFYLYSKFRKKWSFKVSYAVIVCNRFYLNELKVLIVQQTLSYLLQLHLDHLVLKRSFQQDTIVTLSLLVYSPVLHEIPKDFKSYKIR